MAKNDRRALFRDLKSGKLAPVYYLHGPDVFMLDSALEAITAAAAPEGLNDFNHEKFNGKDALGEKLVAAVEQLPFMVDRRLVIVRDVQDMPSAEFEALADYFGNPSPTTVLVLHANTSSKKLDGRSSIVKKMRKCADEYEFKAFYENEVDDFVRMQAQRRNLNIKPEATAYLVEAIGTDLAGHVSALDKLDLYLGVAEDRTIDGKIVREVVANNRVHNVFALTDALGGRELETALGMLESMLHAGESGIKIVSMIARHFRILAKLQDPDVARMSKNDKAKAAGVVPFFVQNYQRDANRFSRTEVQAIRKGCVETDFALKSSRLDEKTIVETLVWDICFRGEETAAV